MLLKLFNAVTALAAGEGGGLPETVVRELCEGADVGEEGLVVRAHLLLAALRHGESASLVRELCGFNDLEAAVGEARKALRELAQRNGVSGKTWAREWAKLAVGDPAKFREAVGKLELALVTRLFMYRFNNDELDAAERLLKEVEELERELAVDRADAVAASWAARLAAVKSGTFQQYLQAASRFEEVWRRLQPLRPPLRRYAYNAAEYAVYLASADRLGEAERMFKEYRHVLWEDKEAAVAAGLAAAMFGVKTDVGPGAVAEALGDELLPPVRLFWGLTSELDTLWECRKLRDPAMTLCVDLVLLYKNFDKAAVAVRSLLEEYVGKETAHALDSTAVAELLAPTSSFAQFVLMLMATADGDEKQAALHALRAMKGDPRPLAQRLYQEIYENCRNHVENCRLALLKTFFFYI
jgi:tetratricopeptide (TPR) repeat protein